MGRRCGSICQQQECHPKKIGKWIGKYGHFEFPSDFPKLFLQLCQVCTDPGALKIIDVGLAKIYDFLAPSAMSVEGVWATVGAGSIGVFMTNHVEI